MKIFLISRIQEEMGSNTNGPSGYPKLLTNEQNQTLSRRIVSLWPFHAKMSHATNNRAYKIDIKDRIDIYQVEYHGDG